jgi:hypothetical protein
MALVCAAVAVAVGPAGPAAAAAAAADPLPGLHVSGNRLRDGWGHVVTLQGVNRSGTEYACIQGWGIFDGPSDPASVAAIASWHVNFVRVLVNEDCWLGIGGLNPVYSGVVYRQAIIEYVDLLHLYGIYPEISLVWAAPGSFHATYQPAAPDQDHSPAVWASLAAAFSGDPNVVLAPWGEPQVDAKCFLWGGCRATYGRARRPYLVVGMQQAVDVMRGAGYRGVIAIPGVNIADDLSQWLHYEPQDPLHQLVAEAHVYGNNTCASLLCLDATMAPVTRKVPLIFGEVGETYDDSSCGHRNMARLLPWATAHHVGYAAWTWDSWGNCESLIRGYDGAPVAGYGAWVRRYYAGTASSERHR